jgi:hypothetical protein
MQKNPTHILDTELSKCVNELSALGVTFRANIHTGMTIQQIMALVVDAFEEEVNSVDDLKKLIISNLSK